VLHLFNDTRSDFPSDRTIHGVFEDAAAAHPGRIAVDGDGGRLTYAELDARANRLARLLRSHGVVPGALVAVCLPRTPEMVVGLLGILKAGAAYLPLDPGQPDARLGRLLRESAPIALLTDRRLAARVRGFEVPVVDLDGAAAGLALLPAGRPPVAVTARDLAYCTYTSGSTGAPKGVLIEHRSVLRLVKGVAYARLEGEALLHAAPLAFDASTFEIWGALLNGGRLVLAPPGPLGPDELARTIERHAVSTLWMTAALFERFTETHAASLRSVRQLLAGGDVLSPAAVARVQAGAPACRLVNGYGPTETTTFAACHVFAPGHVGAAPIGRPIANTRIYILDPNLDPLPVGAAGEIHIAGDGLARGYLSRPDLTAAAFLPDPFGPPGSRMYASGDLGRFRADGTIEFLGRVDHQVKIRGFRVEPGEVEAALVAHPAVREAAVIAHGQGTDKRLVAYVTAATAALPPSADALRAHLRGTLPEPLVPSVFVVLPALPLNANGKLDREALPPLEPGTTPAALPVAGDPATAAAIVAMMTAMVPGAALSAGTDFLEAGFHSIDLMRLVARCRSTFGVPLSMAETVDAVTPEGLAALIAERTGALVQGR
jgi:amino acid adenylation domain-containing protein